MSTNETQEVSDTELFESVITATHKVVDKILKNFKIKNLNLDTVKMSNENNGKKNFESLGKLLFNLVQSEMREAKAPKEEGKQVAKKKPANFSKLLEKCTGAVAKPEPKFILADLNVNGHIDSFKEAKNIIIHIFNVKPYDFSGLTRNHNMKNFSFLIASEAFKKYHNLERPHPEAGCIAAWSMQDLQMQVSTATLISSSCMSNSSNRNLKKASRDLMELLNKMNLSGARRFILDGGLVADDQQYSPY